MRKAIILLHNQEAGQLVEEDNETYTFVDNDSYVSEAISLTMPVSQKIYSFNEFPPFFEGLLPEGIMLEGLLKIKKLDKTQNTHNKNRGRSKKTMRRKCKYMI